VNPAAPTYAAKHDGNLAAIAGIYAMVPQISGAYGWNESDQLAELPPSWRTTAGSSTPR